MREQMFGSGASHLFQEFTEAPELSERF